MRVLLIEDEPTTAKSIELMLGTEGFNVYTTDLGEEGLDLGKLYDYDIICLDLNLPDMHGYDVLKKLRVAKVSTPVLILSGISEMDCKVRALGFGADDYVTKPFHRDELVARIHAVVRRSKGHSQSVIRTGKLAVNLDAKTVEVDGSRVHLTGKEYAMLELLSLRKGTTLTKEMFLNHLYGGMDEPELKIIDVFICKLRKKLSLACGGDNYIETVWGRGYVLRDPEEVSEAGAGSRGRLRIHPSNGGKAGRTSAPPFLCVDQQALAVGALRQAQRLHAARVGLGLVHPPPAVAAEALERLERGLVGHARRAFDPIAEIDVRQAGARGADDMVEDDEGAEALARFRPDVEEAVDHRQAVALLVAEAGADQLAGAAVDRRLAIFDDKGAHRRLLDHVGEVALVHLRHAAAGMARGEVAAQQLILLVGGPRLAGVDLEVGMAAQELALGRAGLELGGEHAHRNAGRAVDAARAVGDRLAAAEADPAQCLVELAGVAAAQLSEHLPLNLAGQIRARARVGDEESGKAEGCAHPGTSLAWLLTSLCGW